MEEKNPNNTENSEVEEKSLDEVNTEVVEDKVVEEARIEEKTLFNDYVMKLPETEKSQQYVVDEPNKPASLLQKIAGSLLDALIIFLLTISLFSAFSNSGLGDGLRSNSYEGIKIQEHTLLLALVKDSEEVGGYKIYSTESKYDDYPKNQKYLEAGTEDVYYIIVQYDGVTDEYKKAYEEALSKNEDLKGYAFNYRLISFGLVAFAGGISTTIFIFIIPLLNKRRASVGKLISGTRVINNHYQVEARWYQMLWRLIWQYLFESILPFLFVNNFIIAGLISSVVLLLISLISKEHRTLHDYVSRTLVIDARTFVRLNEQ